MWSSKDKTRSCNCNNESTLSGVELPIGTTTVVWTVTDEAGNTAECSFDVTVNQSTGIETLESYGIEIYPNPSDGIFYIDISGKENGPVQVEIVNMVGKVVYNKEFISTEKLEINASTLNIGMYLLRVSSKNHTYTKQVIIK